jgi:hypothetical protein
MRRPFITAIAIAPLLFLVSPVAQAISSQQREVKSLSEEFDTSGYEGITLDVSVGEVRIEGADVTKVQAEVRVRCPRRMDLDECWERAEDVEITSDDSRGMLNLEVRGLSKWRSRGMNVDVHFTVPEDLPFELDMGIGEVEIAGMRSDLTVDMGIGEVSVRMDEEIVGSVTLDNGIGESDLIYSDGKQSTSGFLAGKDVVWNKGPGTHAVVVELNIGEIEVRLQ